MIDVIAGPPIDRINEAGDLMKSDEVLLDRETWASIDKQARVARWKPARPPGARVTAGDVIAALAVAPVSWNPETGDINLVTRFRIQITTSPSPPRAGDLVVKRESRSGEE